jgi:hypothetical protein
MDDDAMNIASERLNHTLHLRVYINMVYPFAEWQGPVFQTDFPRSTGSVGLRCAPTYGYTDAAFQAGGALGGGIMDEHTGTGAIFPTLFFDDGNGLKKHRTLTHQTSDFV